MKIAFICDLLGRENNGTTVTLYHLIDSLKERGHSVYVVCPDESKKGEDGFFIAPTLKTNKIYAHIIKKTGAVIAGNCGSLLMSVIPAVDIVYIALPLPLGYGGAEIAAKFGKPIVASFHMQAENITAQLGFLKSRILNARFYKVFYDRLYSHAAAVHYPTEFIKRFFEDRIKRKTPAFVISNGVDDLFFAHRYDEYPRISQKFTILSVGRLSAEKGRWQLIEAVARSKHKEDIKIVFAGDGQDENKLIRLAECKKVDISVGFYPREELIALQHGADIYVHTSLVETEGIALTEAIVSGMLPVVCRAKKSAACTYAVNEALTFDAGDIARLAKIIDGLYEDPSLIQKYKEDYAKIVPSLSKKIYVDKMEAMFFDVLNNSKG